MGSEQLAYASATELLRLIAGKQVSPVELTELFLGRIERLDGRLNSFLLLTRDAAMEQARAAEAAVLRGDELGALHGLPIAIKDTQMTAGIRTTMGSVWFEDRVPERDAAVVERVRAGGAVILGKTNASELGIVGTCQNLLGPDGGNPWNPDYTPGGSSAGAAAALAAYLCPLATAATGAARSAFPPISAGSTASSPPRGGCRRTRGPNPSRCRTSFPRTGPWRARCGTRRCCSRSLPGTTGGTRSRCGRSRPTTSPRRIGTSPACASPGVRTSASPTCIRDVADVTYRAACAFEELGCHVEEPKLALDPPYDTYGALMTADSFNRYRKLYESDGDRLLGYSSSSSSTARRSPRRTMPAASAWSTACGPISRTCSRATTCCCHPRHGSPRSATDPIRARCPAPRSSQISTSTARSRCPSTRADIPRPPCPRASQRTACPSACRSSAGRATRHRSSPHRRRSRQPAPGSSTGRPSLERRYPLGGGVPAVSDATIRYSYFTFSRL